MQRMKRLAPSKNEKILCLPNEPVGSVLIDSRGQWYCLVQNNWRKRAGLRKMKDGDIELAKSKGIVPRPAMTQTDLLTLVVNGKSVWGERI